MNKKLNRRPCTPASRVEAMEPRTLMSIVPVGPEALVNYGNTAGGQTVSGANRSVAADQNGNYVAVWSGPNDGARINAQRYDHLGNPVGGNVVVSGLGNGPEVAMAANGSYVISWTDGDGSDLGIFFQRFDGGGNRVGGVVRANTYTAGKQYMNSTALLDDGRLAVSWVSVGQDGSGNGVYGQRFAANNAKIGSEFRVNNVTVGDQGWSDIAADDTDSEFLITWEHTRPATPTTPPIRSVHAQRFSFEATAITATNPTGEMGGEFRVDDPNTPHTTVYPALDFGPDGGFAFAWGESPGVALNGWEHAWINFRKYAADGAPLAGPVRIDSGIGAYRYNPHVSVDPTGNAVVAWQDAQGDHGNVHSVFVRRVDAAGMPTGVPFSVNPVQGPYINGTGGAGQPSLAHLGTDKFVVAYTYDAGTGTGYDVYTQRVEDVAGMAHDVELTGVYAPRHTDLGRTLAVPVTLRNIGASSEDVTVTLTNGSGVVVGTGTVTGLAPDAGTTLMIDWAGSAALPSNWYDLTATVTLAEGVIDEAAGNNTATDRVRFGVLATSLTYNTSAAGVTLHQTLNGAGFNAGTTYSFVGGTGPAPTVSNINILHEGRVSLDITTYWSKKDKQARTGGTWDLIVTNLDGSTYRLVGALQIV